MIVLPVTQAQMFLSMIITEIMLLSDPNYTVRIGSENYFSLAVGAFVGGLVLFLILAIKFGHGIEFKGYQPKQKVVAEIVRN